MQITFSIDMQNGHNHYDLAEWFADRSMRTVSVEHDANDFASEKAFTHTNTQPH